VTGSGSLRGEEFEQCEDASMAFDALGSMAFVALGQDGFLKDARYVLLHRPLRDHVFGDTVVGVCRCVWSAGAHGVTV
jgi:hypothetical protein